MEGRLADGVVRVGGDARQRFYDSRGYGRPLEGNEIALAPVEAAHLLFRDDLDAVRAPAGERSASGSGAAGGDHAAGDSHAAGDVGSDGDAAGGGGDRMGFREFFAYATGAFDRFGVRYLVYADLRGRGFYCSPAREGWGPDRERGDADLLVYPRGKGPQDGAVAYRLRALGERATVGAAALHGAADRSGAALAIVDEESEITYLDLDRPELDGGTDADLPRGVPAALLDDRVVCWDPPAGLYASAFFGRPLSGRDPDADAAVQLSLVEAAYLAERGAIALEGGVGAGDRGAAAADGPTDGGPADEGPTDGGTAGGAGTPGAVVERGRAVEGERFDRRLAAYRALRDRGIVPKTGFKFGADFRTYAAVESVEDLGHSERLVRVLDAAHRFHPRDLSLDVRLAGGVRKTMTFALVDPDRARAAVAGGGDVDPRWLSVTRLTP